MIALKWIFDSFSIINYNNEEIDYDIISIKKNMLGSFDYLGMDGYDNFLINSKTREIEYVGLKVPQEFIFIDDFLESSDIKLDVYNLKDFILNFNDKSIFQETSKSIFDKKCNDLICVSSLEDKNYKVVIVNEDFYLLFIGNEYRGFILKNILFKIDGYNRDKTDINFQNILIKTLELVNKDTYEKMENRDEQVFKELKKIEKLASDVLDDRIFGLINFIDNCFFAFY